MKTGEEDARKQVKDIMTLGKASQVDINPEDSAVPDTIGTQIVDDTLTVLVDLHGIVDFKAEIQRLTKNLKKAKDPMDNLQRKMAAPGYEDKVPEKLKADNIEKLDGLKKKVSDIEEAIANFERLLSLEETS